MKIILKYLLNNLKERKTRTAVMLLSIILSTTLLFVSLAIGDSYASAQKKMAKGISGTATISVSALPAVNGDMTWISEKAVPDLASIKNKVGILQAPALYNEGGYFENFDIIAADLSKLSQINKPRLLDRGELTDFFGYQVVLPQKFTSKYGIRTGDNIKLRIGGNSFEFRVAAIAAYDTVFLRRTRGFNALIPQDALRDVLNIQNGYSEILIEPDNKIDTDTLKAKLSGALSPENYRVNKIVDDKQVDAEAREKSIPFFLISFFVLTMSIFIIYSSYKVITLERLPMIGTFRSIGATEKAVTQILVMESLLYGILGGLIGTPLGFAVLKLMLRGLGKSISIGIEIPMVVSPLNIILSCVAAIVVSLLSSYLPIKRASKLPVKDVVLGTVEDKSLSNITKLVFSGTLLVMSIILPHGTNGKMLTLAGGASLLSLIVASIVITPFMVNGIASLLEWVYGIVLGNEGQLAARNLKRNKNISQNITLLFISVSAVITISIVSNFAITYIGDVFKGASLDGFADANMDKAFIQKVKSVEGMKALLPVYVLNGNIVVDGQSLGRVEAVEDLPQYNDMLAIRYDSEVIRKDIEMSFNSARNILLSSESMLKRGVKAGDTINLSFGGEIYKYRIIGSFKSRANASEAIIPSECAVNDFGAENYGLLVFQAVHPDAAMAHIRDLFGNKTNWSRTVKEFYADAIGVVGSFLDPLGKLTYVILILAVVGIINNLLINYIQKRRYIAMYKSVGLSNRQNIKMTLIEGFSSGLIGAVFGVVVAYLELRTIFLVAGPRISMEPEIEASVFIMAGTMGIVITLIGSVVPILKGLQMRIVEEIKFE